MKGITEQGSHFPDASQAPVKSSIAQARDVLDEIMPGLISEGAIAHFGQGTADQKADRISLARHKENLSDLEIGKWYSIEHGSESPDPDGLI